MPIKYFKNGALDDNTGVTLSVQEFDDNGNLTFGLMDKDGRPFPGYLAAEITKVEFDEIARQIRDPNIPNGIAGIISTVFEARQKLLHREAKDDVDRKTRRKEARKKEALDRLVELGVDSEAFKQLVS